LGRAAGHLLTFGMEACQPAKQVASPPSHSCKRALAVRLAARPLPSARDMPPSTNRPQPARRQDRPPRHGHERGECCRGVSSADVLSFGELEGGAGRLGEHARQELWMTGADAEGLDGAARRSYHSGNAPHDDGRTSTPAQCLFARLPVRRSDPCCAGRGGRLTRCVRCSE